MSPEVLITFIAACILLALTPGPNMSLILANTLTGACARASSRCLARPRALPSWLPPRPLAWLDDGVHVRVVRRRCAGSARSISSILGARQLWQSGERRGAKPAARSAAGVRAQLVSAGPAASACRTPRCCCSSAPSCPSSSILRADPVWPALRAGRAVRRRAGGGRRRLHVRRRQGARPPSMQPGCVCSTGRPASSCCSAAWRWR